MTGLKIAAAVVVLAWLAWLSWKVARLAVAFRWLRRDTSVLLSGHDKLRRQLGWGDDLDVTQLAGNPRALTQRFDPAVLELHRKRSSTNLRLDRASPKPPALPDAEPPSLPEPEPPTLDPPTLPAGDD
jgi:hypothetical protein